jgi:tetratricopeptide (TPR) repeat protein
LHLSLKEKGLDLAAHLIVFAIIYGFLLSYFTPTYLLSKTITTGGDTPSHYAAADYLIHTLLPKGKIIGWMPGNYAGFPLFQFYFPLPFLIMALLQVIMPLQIAFKLVTVLGTFLLPVCAYGCLRLLRQPSPIPAIGAIFTLPFLFMEANSMWGGNIPSTLSGEFAYSLGFALLVLYIGSFYRGIKENRYALINAMILTLIGLAHGYTLLFAVVASTFFLFTTDGFSKKLWYYLRVNTLAFLLLGFWFIQLLWFIPYTTPFNFVWVLDGISQVFPGILLPIIGFAVIGTILVLIHRVGGKRIAQRKGHIFLYLWLNIFVAGSLYFIAYKINLVDIRFLPYVQFFLLLLGAMGLGYMTEWMKARSLLAPFLVVLVILWANEHVSYIPKWIEWDYSGFEAKRTWPQFRALNEYLKGSYQDPRVVYEHDLQNRATGSVRAFESLPLFSGRSTLEGLYIQSSITSPFVFYLQSEISPRPSCPLPSYNYSRMNFQRGLEHLKIFNVSHLIAVTDDVRKALERSPEAIREKDFPPYTIYRLRKNPGRYVSLLQYEPVLMITRNWRRIAFEWFRRGDLNTHIVFKDKLEPADSKLFKTIIKDQLPENPISNPTNSINPINPINPTNQIGGPIKETIKPEEIIIETTNIGLPHLIRVSYHPNWHVEGADRIYLISPSFMLIYPTQERVRLYFGRSFPNHLGLAFSLIGVIIIFISVKPIWSRLVVRYPLSVIWKPFSNLTHAILPARLPHFRHSKQLLRFIMLGIIGTLLLIMFAIDHNDATIIYNKGLDHFKKGDYREARRFFEKGIRDFPLSPIIDQTAFQFAITYFKEDDWQKALDAFQKMAKNYPESRKLPEVLYHIGICHLRLHQPEKAIQVFEEVIEDFPEDKWAGYARERLREMGL